MKNKGKQGKRILRGESGFTLVEVLISIAIVTVAGTALLLSLVMATKVLMGTDSDETARDYAQAQMESIQNLPYDDGAVGDPSLYTPTTLAGLPDGYLVNLAVASVATDVQKITITVTPGPNRPFVLEGYKVDY